MAQARILYIEDNDDIRDTMALLLEHGGFAVTARATAEAGLQALERERYDLVLADYQLPAENAGWLVRTGRERGLLAATPVIILSGASDLPELEGCRLLRKPVSQETLFAAFDAVLPARPAPAPARVGDEPMLRLRLYVSGASHASNRATRNLRAILRDVPAGRVDLTVIDVDADDPAAAAAAEQDRIVVTPTLVRDQPGPRVWIAGDLSDGERVRDAILPGSTPMLA